MVNNKKAISPFIAAVILIIVAVAIGVIVANFIRGYVGGTLTDARDQDTVGMSCATDVEFSVYETSGGLKEQYISSDGNDVTLTLQNTGNMDISFIIYVIGNDILQSNDNAAFPSEIINVSTDTITQGEVKRYRVSYNDAVINMTDITVVPAYYTAGRLVICDRIGTTISRVDLRESDTITTHFEASV